jgi:hypothetical protein
MVVALFACISCNNSHVNTENTNAPTTAAAPNPFAGWWVDQGYVDTLLKTKSPRASQGDEELLYFPKLLHDTCFLAVFHEGGGQFTLVAHGKDYYIKYDNGDSALVEIMDQQHIKTRGKIFVSVPGTDETRVSEKFLLKGEYAHGDKTIVLTENGEIQGLDSFKYYLVWNDYYGPGLDLDLMDLGRTRDEHIEHAFQIVGDTLLIYATKCIEQHENGDCYAIDYDKLKYTLVRKKN